MVHPQIVPKRAPVMWGGYDLIHWVTTTEAVLPGFNHKVLGSTLQVCHCSPAYDCGIEIPIE